MAKIVFIIACGLAFMAPFILTKDTSPRTRASAPGIFPARFEGRALHALGLSEREAFFVKDFPGDIGRFTDGSREIVIRRVTEATRKLHPSSDCFRATGYTTTPLPVKIDEDKKQWSCFNAARGDEKLRVCERIEASDGREWTDVSAWYWAAWGAEGGEWWAYTVAEHD